MKNLNQFLTKKNLRILVTRTDRIGDVVLSTPVFSAIKKKFPECYLAAMCLPGTREILEDNPFIDEVIVYDKRGSEKRWLKVFSFGFGLRKKKFDVAVHLHPTNRVHILSFLAGIPVRLGYSKKLDFLLTHQIPEMKFKGEKHEAKYNFDLLSFLGVTAPECLELYFPLNEVDKNHLEDLCARENIIIPEKSFIINPSASCPESKRWPPERFAMLADCIQERYGFKPIIIGDGPSQDIARRMEEVMKHEAINLTGKVTLKDVAVLFCKVKFLISNDTGPVHIAAALDLPVISIFGRLDPGLDPKRWRPLGEKSFFLHKPPDCEPCLAHNCEINFECLTNITVEAVLELLGQQAGVFGLT